MPSEQVLKQRAIVPNRLTKVFRTGLALRVPNRDGVASTIVLDKSRVIHRDVCCALLEVLHWVASFAHHFREQDIRLS